MARHRHRRRRRARQSGGRRAGLSARSRPGRRPTVRHSYDPDGTGSGLTSLGVHEHWNNSTDKQYSRNLATGNGIQLLAVDSRHDGDFDGDTLVTAADFTPLEECLAGPDNPPDPNEPPTPTECLTTFDFDFDNDLDLRDFLAFQLAFTAG